MPPKHPPQLRDGIQGERSKRQKIAHKRSRTRQSIVSF
jgi:hypothetical protein